MDVFLDRVRRVESVALVPDGTYHGTWSGYTVKFETPDGVYEGRSTQWVRGLNVPCTVEVTGNQFRVTR